MPRKSTVKIDFNRRSSTGRLDFSKIDSFIDPPFLLREQIESYNLFLQADIPPDQRKEVGLEKVFRESFPVEDLYGKFELDYVDYEIGRPAYSMDECRKWNMTYQAPLKVRFILKVFETEGDEPRFKEAVEGVTYLGDVPIMTENGSFIINGAERVIVTQLHRSPGVFFDKAQHPNGTILFTGRIIPAQGAWIEFRYDIKDVLHIYFGSKQKCSIATLLRSFGYSSSEMTDLFYDKVEVPLDGKAFTDAKTSAYLAEDVFNPETGEIFAEVGTLLDKDLQKLLSEKGLDKVNVVFFDEPREVPVLFNCIHADPTNSHEEAVREIINLIRPGDVVEESDIENALDEYLFNKKRLNLANVGRFKINFRLGVDVDLDTHNLTKIDLIEVIKALFNLRHGLEQVDDIDHLGLRRAKSVGELVEQNIHVAILRMNRTVRERMRLKENEELTPQKLVNARTVNAALNSFFGSSQLSQFMQQTNPLDELTHKRRLSALGPGGLTRERAGFEVRDVHHTHYGRMCPIETPEGQNIGLITSLSVFARLNEYGFIETPYRKIEKRKATNIVEYLTADDEDKYIIAQANIKLGKDKTILEEKVLARHKGDVLFASPDEVQYMDISPVQLVSMAASLIPFLEHDDANRALMGSNMQRQAVPLMFTETPYVATGLEAKAARDSGAVVVAKRDGEVKYVDADKILIVPNPDQMNELFEPNKVDEYKLKKFERSNQDTTINQRPIVKVGQQVNRGDVLADGAACKNGELALGKELTVAFMPWRGYNFEDAIILNERLVKDDIYTSIHIERFEVQVRETKRGPEELTNELPNVSEEAVRNLDEYGVIRSGAEVESGDILVGKVTPKGEKESTPEERLLRAIFGEKAGDVKNTSLKAPPGMKGTVIDTVMLSRKEFSKEERAKEKKVIQELVADSAKIIRRIEQKRNRKVKALLQDIEIRDLLDKETGDSYVPAGTVMKPTRIKTLKLESLNLDQEWTVDPERNMKIREIFKIADALIQRAEEDLEIDKNKIQRGDQLPPGVLKLVKVDIAKKLKVQIGDKMAGRHGNKGVVSIIVPQEDMPMLPSGEPIDIILNPLGVPSRMNIGQLLETHLGMACHYLGDKCETPVFSGATVDEIKGMMEEAGMDPSGKILLRNGMTGDPFDRPATVGKMYMIKLAHLAEDKLHARSIGPYSLVTQQPLGGKAQFGGQRFGEMEVWALEAYGASYTLQEMLTVKSDDVTGRARIYEAIVKGENPPEPGIPESFNVLIKELRSLGLDIQLLDEE